MNVPLRPLNWYKKLATKKGRLKAGEFLVEGDKAIRQIIGNHPNEIIEIVAVEEPPSIYRDYPLRLITESQFRSICLTRTPQGIMAIVRLPMETYSDETPLELGNKVLLLEDIQDPGNIGTLIRTAAAFDYSGIILTESCADPFSPKCVQSTAGTVLSVWLRRTKRYLELVDALSKKDYPLIAADLHGEADPSILYGRKKILLALGNEASGLSSSLLKIVIERIRIPTVSEKAESLNVAACGAICMYLTS
jgi:TrmH family RNA methyltransferase